MNIFRVQSGAIVQAQNKSILALLNGLTGVSILLLVRIFARNADISAVTGVGCQIDLEPITGFSSGSAATPIALDAAGDTLDAGVTAGTGTTVAGASAVLSSTYANNDEVPATLIQEFTEQPIFEGNMGIIPTPIILRPGHGLSVKFVTNSTVAHTNAVIDFLQLTPAEFAVYQRQYQFKS